MFIQMLNAKARARARTTRAWARTIHLTSKGKAQQLCGRGQVIETGEQILDSLVYLTRVNPVHVEVEIKH